jgi:hypothetical protein
MSVVQDEMTVVRNWFPGKHVERPPATYVVDSTDRVPPPGKNRLELVPINRQLAVRGEGSTNKNREYAARFNRTSAKEVWIAVVSEVDEHWAGGGPSRERRPVLSTYIFFDPERDLSFSDRWHTRRFFRGLRLAIWFFNWQMARAEKLARHRPTKSVQGRLL